MQKWLLVAVFTMLALVTAMGVRNLTVNASVANSRPVLTAWGGLPVPPSSGLSVVVGWGGLPVPKQSGKSLN